MKPSLLALAALPLLSACIVVVDGAEVQLDEDHRHRSEEPRWQTLFDGSSLAAWRGFKKEEVPDGWQIVDGALTRVAEAGDLITREQFEDFELVFEWRVDPGANSGVMFHVDEAHGQTYETGPEYQILDNARLGDAGDPRTSAAANYALHAPPADYTKPVGEWNQGRLSVEEGRVRHWLNGHVVVEYRLWTEGWRELVAASKFDAMPGYGQNRSGHIALQDHGDRVSYRNIKIRSL